MELRLAEKEEKLLEKALIFEEVNRLSERTKKKAETGKEDTLTLAKKVTMYSRLYTYCIMIDYSVCRFIVRLIAYLRIQKGPMLLTVTYFFARRCLVLSSAALILKL